MAQVAKSTQDFELFLRRNPDGARFQASEKFKIPDTFSHLNHFYPLSSSLTAKLRIILVFIPPRPAITNPPLGRLSGIQENISIAFFRSP